ncbi:MAG: bifunctional glycosyltransferase/class I SAM-dependent methyltransferase [Acidimicrobiia bacterium]
MPTLSVLMPVYNESRTLRTIVARVLESPVECDIELICVDDCSGDDSLAILHDLAKADSRIKVIAQPVNMGKGKAIRTAIEAMTGDIGIIQDADLEYDPGEYPRVLGPILSSDADAVYGSRFAASEVRRVLFFWHSLGNKLLTTLSNMANDLNLTDMETCYKAVRGDLLKSLRLTCDRFGLEPEITARLAQADARIYEVPISYRGRTYAEGKSIGWRDGLEALWLIFKFRFIDTKSTQDAGHLTLESLGTVPAVSRWMLSNFTGHMGKRVLEAGSGSGNLTEHLLDRRQLTVVDLDPRHVGAIRRRFGHLENVDVREGDLESSDLYLELPKVDSVLSVNVLEHLDKPESAVRGFHDILEEGGTALILVPAHEWLYSRADVALGHRSRYTVEQVRALLETQDFEVEFCREFNRLGVLGWMFNKLMGRTSIGRFQARMFGILLPLAMLVERLSFLPGLSIVAVARRR